MDLAQAYTDCVEQTAEFVHKAGFEDVVIGLSGGIDSTLVAVIASDALGSEHVHGIMLPGPYSTIDSLEDAKALVANTQIDSMIIPIDAPYEAFAHVISEATGEALGGLASENTQARCRMVCIMALSNARDWMMLNTGNKSEAAMGYSTLYGDTAGAFAPIGGLYKTEIFAMCRWRNAMASMEGDVPPIPENVILKPPSAELAPNQKDETSMGIDYKTLDSILLAHVEEGKDADAIIAKGYAPARVNMVINRYNSYAFKRALEPTYAQVTR